MFRRGLSSFVLIQVVSFGAADAATIHVPGDYGWIMQAVDAAEDGDEIIVAPGSHGGPVNYQGKAIAIRSSGGPEVTTILGEVFITSGEGPGTLLEGFTTGRFHTENSSPTIRSCVVSTQGGVQGGAFRSIGGNLTLEGCTFTGNTAGTASGGYRFGAGLLTVTDCVFSGNTAEGAAGLVVAHGDALIVRTRFEGNLGSTGGLVLADTTSQVISCTFTNNGGGFLGGGCIANRAVFPASEVFVNCLFEGNSAKLGSGIYTNSHTSFVNCTFFGNSGSAIMYDTGSVIDVVNSILWGNSGEIVDDGDDAATVTASHCTVQGGFPGPNIDADPLFVQPGVGDLRLSVGSPCVDAGDASALPVDAFDLDGDGDTAEPLPLDLAGGPRVLDGFVDMGVYEGAFEGLPPAATDTDLDQGEYAILVPDNGAPDPLANAWVLMQNASGPDNAFASLTEFQTDLHPEAGSFGVLGSTLSIATSLQDGQHRTTIYHPFQADALGVVASEVMLTWYNEDLGTWMPAVLGNTGNSPDHDTVVGDRVYVEGGLDFGVTGELGDHGVYLDPVTQSGFAWAVVDHASDFAFGRQLCTGDCAPIGGDSIVGVEDLVSVILAWDADPASTGCDMTIDGAVDTHDLVTVLTNWGVCGP